MANPEHLKILKQGVKAWNKWREENLKIIPDLSNADLGGLNLAGANLNSTNLSGVDLSGVRLREADLFEAKLWKADLSGADLSGAHLSEANLSEADLTGADLFHADLTRANLSGAKFTEAELSEAYLIEAQLNGADLVGAQLKGADLRDADLRYCRLVETNLSDAILIGVKLYGTARDNWEIKGVKCLYMYWDEGGREKSPKDRYLEPGEFEKLYAALPFFEYVFRHGMSPLDPLIMDRVVEAIRERHPEWDIKIDSINARGLAPSIKFTVQHEEHKEPALEEVRKGYEAKIAQLEAERDRYWEAIRHALDKPRRVKLISAGPGSIVATDGSTVNIEQHVNYALQLQKAIAEEPEESKSFAKAAKKTALDIIGGAIKDIAKGQVKEAAKQIIELGKDLGPLFVRMAPLAYEFFKNVVT